MTRFAAAPDLPSRTRPRRAQSEDVRLHGEVAAALSATGHPHLRNVDIRVHSGRVVLAGFVATYYTKQVAQATVLGIREVVQLVNDIEVV
jgi:osmotically-inducible protein OsmY